MMNLSIGVILRIRFHINIGLDFTAHIVQQQKCILFNGRCIDEHDDVKKKSIAEY